MGSNRWADSHGCAVPLRTTYFRSRRESVRKIDLWKYRIIANFADFPMRPGFLRNLSGISRQKVKSKSKKINFTSRENITVQFQASVHLSAWFRTEYSKKFLGAFQLTVDCSNYSILSEYSQTIDLHSCRLSIYLYKVNLQRCRTTEITFKGSHRRREESGEAVRIQRKLQ